MILYFLLLIYVVKITESPHWPEVITLVLPVTADFRGIQLDHKLLYYQHLNSSNHIKPWNYNKKKYNKLTDKSFT
jgi:hypothetical protein